MARFVYDKDLGCTVPAENRNYFQEEELRSEFPAPMIMGAFRAYRTVAGDEANGGKPVTIHSRDEHKAFLRRNGYAEVGNEPIRQKPHVKPPSAREHIKKAINDLNYQNVPTVRQLCEQELNHGSE